MLKGGMQGMMKQVQKLQAEMEKKQAELRNKVVSEESGGGMVKATVNGQKELVNIEINEEVISVEDKEMLEDLVVAAVNKAIESAGKMAEDEMSQLTKGMIPPGMNIPGL
jgi:DNA-binding YbaB/EbfC family protein